MTLMSYEVPLANLWDFDSYQDQIFALSFLCKDSRYLEYLTSCKKRGKRIILDNSYNELGEPDSAEEMIDLFYRIEADKVVSPDKDGWSPSQLALVYERLVQRIPEHKIYVVVKTQEEYKWYCYYIRKSAYCTTYEQRAKLPPNILNLCTHFLGLINPWEIQRFHPKSCDTAMPIKLAMMGIPASVWEKMGYPHIKTFPDWFNLQMTQEEIKLAMENIEWLTAKIVH